MQTETATPPLSPPEQVRARKFSVSDGMALIAGLALAIAGGSTAFEMLSEKCGLLCRVIAAYNSPFYVARPQFWEQSIAIHWGSVVWYAFWVFQVLLLSMTPAFLLIRLRRPRPPLRAMLKQPGTVAGLAVVIGYLLVAGWLHRFYVGGIDFRIGNAIAVGGTVLVAWAILALSRQWESEPSWVDRMGRLIGATAIVLAVVAFVQFGI
jgi:hypothetical protein